MNFKKLAVALSMAGATVFSGAAFADPSITNLDGTSSPFGGFDWAGGAAAYTTGFTGVPGSTFTLTYAGWATAVWNTSLGSMSLPGLDTTADGTANSIGQQFNIPGHNKSYEYTEVATFTEKVISCNATATACTFQVLSGNFDIYYDTAANANAAAGAWTGFADGTKIISGTYFGGAQTTFDNGTGGKANVAGMVTMTNSTYINPALTGTAISSTLQLGQFAQGFQAPTSLDGNVIGPGQIVLQADANQTFTTVPEPSTLALVGLALSGFGLAARRRKN